MTGSLAGWFRQGLRAAPGGVALRVGDDEWTYADLDAYARRLAGAVAGDQGRTPVVGVLAARSIACYAGILAAAYAGAVVVPLSPGFPAGRTAAMARAAGVTHLIHDGYAAGAADELTALLPQLLVVPPEGGTPLPAPVPVDPSDPAYVLFTSGSTGRPKGAPVTHANMDHFLSYAARRYQLGPADVCSQTFDTTFDLAMFDLFVTWSAGATLVSTPAQVFRSLPSFVAAHRLTVWFSVPSAIALVRRVGGLTPGSMPTLRWSLFCGEPLLGADAAAWQAAAPASTVENLYGPTEVTLACSVHRWDPERSPAACVNGVVPIGEVFPGLKHRLRDVDDESAGELCLAGPQVFPGYLDPGDDEGRLLEIDGRTWYATGDVVRRTAAGLVFLGRTDHQVKIRGYRVEPAELEARLRELPGVEDAVVVPVRHRGSLRLAAWYTGAAAPAGELRDRLAGSVPEFMVPHWFRHLEAVPLNDNNKLDRRVLAGRAQRLADDDAA